MRIFIVDKNEALHDSWLPAISEKIAWALLPLLGASWLLLQYPDIVLCVLGAKKLYVYIIVISSMGLVGYYFSLHMMASVLSSKRH